MNGILIRPMREGDLAQASALERVCFTSEAWSEKVYREEFSRAGTCIWLWSAVPAAASEERIVGTISLTRMGEDGEIGNVAVLPQYRGQGIAGALLKTALGYGEQEQGMTLFTLEVRASNAAAIHLYESAGFRCEGIRPRFYTEPEEDAMIMWKGRS